MVCGAFALADAVGERTLVQSRHAQSSTAGTGRYDHDVGAAIQTDSRDPDSLELILDQVSRAVDRQFDQIDSLNNRAQQLLGFSGVILGLVVGLRAEKGAAPAVLFGLGVAIFLVVVGFGLRAWAIHGWRRDPSPGAFGPVTEIGPTVI